MRYPNILKAEFIQRPNRFIAEVLINGRRETVHVKNTGRCRELLIPGCDVWLTEPGTAGRKTRYDLVAVRKGNGRLINIDSQAPNKAMLEWLGKQNCDRIVPEYTYGDSRIDFYIEKDGKKTLMEVKGCTLEIDGTGYFPDAPTLRGVKHIRDLIKAKQKGHDAVLAFVIQTEGITEVHPNTTTHPEFGTAMKEAVEKGVRVLFFTCSVTPDELMINGFEERV